MTEQFLQSALHEVPNYYSYLTVSQLDASSWSLAEMYPKLVEIEEIGRSRANYPIQCLRIGTGSKNALLFGFPHPNEPVGAMMVEYLSRRLCEDEALRRVYDYTWYLIKCIDPDGARLNEGWFDKPFTPTSYAKHFYRPAGKQMVEWTFPIDYKNYHFDRPIPETRALMRIIEKVRPDFMYSLHNAGLGGAYFYVSQRIPEHLQNQLRALVADYGLPLKLGEPEMPYAVQFGAAVYKSLTAVENYEYFAQYVASKDPAELMSAGASSIEYASRFQNTLGLVCEVPYFVDWRVADLSLSSSTRREAILAACDWEESFTNAIKDLYEQAQPHLLLRTPFSEALESYLSNRQRVVSGKRQWADEPEMRRSATVAEEFDLLAGRFHQVLYLGLFLRMLDVEIALRPNSPLRTVRQEAEGDFGRYCKEIERLLDYQSVPIKTLVQVQLASALHVALHVQKT